MWYHPLSELFLRSRSRAGEAILKAIGASFMWDRLNVAKRQYGHMAYYLGKEQIWYENVCEEIENIYLINGHLNIRFTSEYLQEELLYLLDLLPEAEMRYSMILEDAFNRVPYAWYRTDMECSICTDSQLRCGYPINKNMEDIIWSMLSLGAYAHKPVWLWHANELARLVTEEIEKAPGCSDERNIWRLQWQPVLLGANKVLGFLWNEQKNVLTSKR